MGIARCLRCLGKALLMAAGCVGSALLMAGCCLLLITVTMGSALVTLAGPAKGVGPDLLEDLLLVIHCLRGVG